VDFRVRSGPEGPPGLCGPACRVPAEAAPIAEGMALACRLAGFPQRVQALTSKTSWRNLQAGRWKVFAHYVTDWSARSKLNDASGPPRPRTPTRDVWRDPFCRASQTREYGKSAIIAIRTTKGRGCILTFAISLIRWTKGLWTHGSPLPGKNSGKWLSHLLAVIGRRQRFDLGHVEGRHRHAVRLGEAVENVRLRSRGTPSPCSWSPARFGFCQHRIKRRDNGLGHGQCVRC
jgi:hypothetical protein